MQQQITVRDALAFPEVVAGAPELIAGGDGLDRPIRWAHVVAGTGAIALLEGGEIVLTTGAGWPRSTRGLEALARQIAASDTAAVLLELGTSFTAAPSAFVSACEDHAIPLVVLHREVRFVQITQRIHQRILAAQTEALVARTEVHSMLTELGLNRSPVDYVIERLADTLRAPVVLEDSAHRVVAWADRGQSPRDPGREPVPPPGPPENEVGPATEEGERLPRSSAEVEAGHPLDSWARAEGRGFELPAGWERVPVEAQGRRWGHLTALRGPAHPAGRRTVLELGAFALALGQFADREDEQWLQLGSKRMFDVMLGGRYSRRGELAVQLAAAGLPVRGRMTLGATLRGVGAFGTDGPLERAMLETALRRAVAPEGRVIITAETDDTIPSASIAEGRRGAAARGGARRSQRSGTVLLVLLSFPPGDPRIPGAAALNAPAPSLAARLARELDMLLPSTTPGGWRAHLGLGTAGTQVRALITSLERVRTAGMLSPVAGVGRVTVQQAERQPLAYLVRGLAASPEMQEFVAEVLDPIIAHDTAGGPGHSGDLLSVLSAYLEHPTNRSLAAAHAQLSRSVFYQRLALIEELLGVDLADGTVIATLTVALLARGAR
ncbi:PucR family transcriptional regulator [Kocuria coralli]|uniref:PucR family transcriptional regulator n=1 Tax=Kocuria coralli TaxID=1461025 RepID=A0A5J5L0X9_9MICC|nr:PucR family transcriptional regulator [Kocuria coralli]KAA9395493.1 PucR family transcriptional regulator [Kocuria coralli]